MADLKRKLTFWPVFCIASGAMISSGLFVLPGQAFKMSGPAVVLAYALAALLVIPALVSKAELATAMPKSGGDYFFVERSLGTLAGTLAGLAAWLSMALKSAFAMVGIGAFARLIWPQPAWTEDQWEWTIKLVAAGCCMVFAALNMLSVKAAGRLQVVLVAVLLGVLALFIGAGTPAVQQHPNFDHFLDAGWGNVFATAALVFVSFGGLTKVASVAEEVREPGRTLPRAMFAAYAVVSVVYVAAIIVVVGVVDAASLARGTYGSLTPLSDAAGKFLGTGGLVLLSAAAITAFVTTGNSGIMAASRGPLAMSRDGLLPGGFAKVSSRFGTPHVSILVTTGFMVVAILGLSIGGLVKVASTMKLILFLLTNVAVLIMRGSKIRNYRPPYRGPLFPWLYLAGVGVYGMLIVMLVAKLGVIPLLTTGGFLLAALLWFVVYVRPRAKRESALVYMVRTAAAKEMHRSEFEEELRDIALERDGIIHDRFDQLIQHCTILDISGQCTSGEMFARAAEALSGRLGLDRETLEQKFHDREATSSTVLSPGLAIPHVVVEGEGLFELLLVRNREGVEFGEGKPHVHAAFVLVGSADERNYHLRALMAIAHIAQEEEFEHRWLSAPGAEGLRDICLLSDRKRDHDG